MWHCMVWCVCGETRPLRNSTYMAAVENSSHFVSKARLKKDNRIRNVAHRLGHTLLGLHHESGWCGRATLNLFPLSTPTKWLAPCFFLWGNVRYGTRTKPNNHYLLCKLYKNNPSHLNPLLNFLHQQRNIFLGLWDLRIGGQKLLGIVSTDSWMEFGGRTRTAATAGPRRPLDGKNRWVTETNADALRWGRSQPGGSRRQPTGDRCSLCRTGEDGKVKYGRDA